MFSVAQLLDAAKANGKIESDYRLAKVIGISHNVISGYRHGKSMPNEKILGQLCALSGDDVAVVAAQVQAERAQSAEGKTMWMMIAKRLAGGATTAILSVVFAIALIAGYAPSARAGGLFDVKTDNSTVYTSYQSRFCQCYGFYLAVTAFILVRLRRFAGFFRLTFSAALAI